MLRTSAIICIALCSIATANPIDVSANSEINNAPHTKESFFLPKLPLPKLPFDKPKGTPIEFPLSPEIAEKFPIIGEVLKELFPGLVKEQEFIKVPQIGKGEEFGKGPEFGIGPFAKGPEFPKRPFPKGPEFGIGGQFPQGPEEKPIFQEGFQF